MESGASLTMFHMGSIRPWHKAGSSSGGRNKCPIYSGYEVTADLFSFETTSETSINMSVVLWLLVFGLPALHGESLPRVSCPCSDKKLCQRINTTAEKEVLVFSTSSQVWKHYDWSTVTTVAVFRKWDDELMCFAHSKGVKVVLVAGYSLNDLSNITKRQEWVKNLTSSAFENHADGVNIDIEGPLKKGTKQVSLLSDLTAEVYQAFKENLPGSQVTFDVAWSPDCIDGRCYDVLAISKVVDFLVIMAYDEMSQIFGPVCAAYANSPFNKTKTGVSQYRDLGIKADKLVLGLPWYGYDYPCLNINDTGLCLIKKVPFRGAACSDAAGTQIGYSRINDLLQSRTDTGRKWHKASQSPSFDYYDASDKRHQVW